MNPSVCVLALCFAAALGAPGHLGVAVVGPSEPGRIIKGPVVHSTVVGTDGIPINSVADSGAVVAAPKAGGVVTADAAIAPGVLTPVAPVVTPVVAHIAPVAPIVAPVARIAPVVAPIAQIAPLIAPVAPIAHVAPISPLVYGQVSSVVSHGLVNGHIVSGIAGHGIQAW